MGNFLSHIQTLPFCRHTLYCGSPRGSCTTGTHARARAHTHTPTQYSEKPEYMTQLQVCVFGWCWQVRVRVV